MEHKYNMLSEMFRLILWQSSAGFLFYPFLGSPLLPVINDKLIGLLCWLLVSTQVQLIANWWALFNLLLV